MSHPQLNIIYGGAKLNLPFDIRLLIRIRKMFYEMNRLVIMIDGVRWQPKN